MSVTGHSFLEIKFVHWYHLEYETPSNLSFGVWNRRIFSVGGFIVLGLSPRQGKNNNVLESH